MDKTRFLREVRALMDTHFQRSTERMLNTFENLSEQIRAHTNALTAASAHTEIVQATQTAYGPAAHERDENIATCVAVRNLLETPTTTSNSTSCSFGFSGDYAPLQKLCVNEYEAEHLNTDASDMHEKPFDSFNDDFQTLSVASQHADNMVFLNTRATPFQMHTGMTGLEAVIDILQFKIGCFSPPAVLLRRTLLSRDKAYIKPGGTLNHMNINSMMRTCSATSYTTCSPRRFPMKVPVAQEMMLTG